MPLRLTPHLIPKPLFGKRAANLLSRSLWDAIRNDVLTAAKHECGACMGPGIGCHEVWLYDDESGIATLAQFEILCCACHEVAHMGRAVTHGVVFLLAQYKAFGHAIPGVIEPTLEEYTHLGDAASKTDEKIYSEKMSPTQSDGTYSGVPDDRWAFTVHTTPLDYDAASALTAAGRVLHGFDDKMADECLRTAERV